MTNKHTARLLSSYLQRLPAHSWLVLVFWALIIAPVQAAVELRIAISKGVSAVSVGSSTDAVVKDGAGRVLGEL
ncbi:MAG: sporulation protein, partial [Microcystis sp.]